ncbi:hypothetical protein LPJ64_001909 [Coemansia asiatica]|uniref:Transmembrane protein n=1 Tax=Coemansia asiatica TaxID=1052880 RepID=A0A9W8CL11_9FUNG|nr:hypothetical protein LPJ64_001909 [Coemansia asiatica]
MENNSSDTTSDKDKNRLICLDTESSICLAFDKSLYSSRMLSAMAENRSIDPSVGQDIHMVPATGSSSETHFIPRVQEVNGSSDSQQKIQSVAESTKGIKAASDSSNHMSVVTADMAYAGDTEDYLQGVSDADTEMDRELQAAVDMVLNGEVNRDDGRVGMQRMGRRRAFYSSNGILGSARLLTGKIFKANGSSFVPVDNQQNNQEEPEQHEHRRLPVDQQGMADVPIDDGGAEVPSAEDNTETNTPGYFKRLNIKGLLASARFARTRNQLPTLSEGVTSMSSLEKEATERKITNGLPDPSSKTTVRAVCCLPEPVASTPFQGNRLLRPVVRFMQKRPMASLGIALTALAILLVVIIVVLVVCVFPFLMRTTLQDVSVVLTQVHAVPPAEVARDLRIGTAGRHSGRVAVEPLGMAVDRRGVANNKQHWAHEIKGESPNTMFSSIVRGQMMASAAMSSHHGNHLRHETMSNSIASASSHRSPANTVTAQSAAPVRQAPIEDVVTLTSIVTNTVHVAQHSTLGTAQPTHSFTPAAAIPTFLDAVKDATVASTSYMMQLAGNLTSGGPIGVSIEFTEPLRLLWRDTEVGVISRPEKIHIPGRGTTQFTWPPFEVIVAGGPSQMQNADRLLVAPSAAPLNSVGGGGGVAQRRTIGAGSVPVLGKTLSNRGFVHEGLADWFDAIQSHVPFTMQWRSRVKLSAMGLHTDNILFDKTVNILCGEARNCTIDGSAFFNKN